MSTHAYTEDQLVEQPAIGLFADLDWQELPDAKACRIAAWYPGASIGDESRWDEYLAWLTQRLVKMDQVLRPVVKGLP